MRRRYFITLLGGAVAWPIASRGRPHTGPVRLGFLPIGSPRNAYDRSLAEAFQEGLRRVGLIENQDIVLDVVWVGDDPDGAVSQVLKRGAELLITSGSSVSVAARSQTSTIPIVFLHVGDPMAMGLIESLSHPGRNATGFSDILAELSGKFVDLAIELTRPQKTIFYLWHTAWPDGQNRYRTTEQAVHEAGMQLRAKGIADITELDSALTAMKENGLGTIFAFPVAAREGSLVAYGPDYLHMYRRAQFYVDRILKGAKPADLPVEQPTRVELLVNLQVAKALGIDIPLSLLIRADDLLE
jgi:putative tryptophan/tyrosine transport system substrate-binding protein